MGVGGSGRKSLTMMAVHIAEFQMFTIEITKSYGMPDWREDIKVRRVVWVVWVVWVG